LAYLFPSLTLLIADLLSGLRCAINYLLYKSKVELK
jgi:hypothetical protein